MRLWHKDMVEYLPKLHLQGQWRELRAIDGIFRIHGRLNHSTINPIMDFGMEHFATYYRWCYLVCADKNINANYNFLSPYRNYTTVKFAELFKGWHNDEYLTECMINLELKWKNGVILDEDWKVLTDRFIKDLNGNYSSLQ